MAEIGGRQAEPRGEQKVTDGQAESVPNVRGDDSWCRGDSAANWLLVPAGEKVICPLTSPSGRKTIVVSTLVLPLSACFRIIVTPKLT